ncbi:hypothetical protein DXG01_016666 [Tephrocybe rancida]|nr:hypothetical protein DXG01_016666 [Tephrocybe rancida]
MSQSLLIAPASLPTSVETPLPGPTTSHTSTSAPTLHPLASSTIKTPLPKPTPTSTTADRASTPQPPSSLSDSLTDMPGGEASPKAHITSDIGNVQCSASGEDTANKVQMSGVGAIGGEPSERVTEKGCSAKGGVEEGGLGPAPVSASEEAQGGTSKQNQGSTESGTEGRSDLGATSAAEIEIPGIHKCSKDSNDEGMGGLVDGELDSRELGVQYGWMKGGQKCNVHFVGDWWGWWGSLKRGKNDDDVSIKTDPVIDWNSLNKHGPCGFILVVWGLAWWGYKCREHLHKYDGVGGWLATLRKVTRILNEIVEKGQESKEDMSTVKK